MRLGSFFLLLCALSAFSAAQDTSFSSGPQYLITTNSTLFLRPITTPTLSLSVPLATAPAAENAQPASSPSAGIQSQPDLTRIYWGAPEVSEASGERVSEIEISSAQLSRPLPASLVDVGVTGMTDAQSLRERGYGVSLGETASFWKAHKPRAPRVYTNTDTQRLHPKE